MQVTLLACLPFGTLEAIFLTAVFAATPSGSLQKVIVEPLFLLDSVLLWETTLVNVMILSGQMRSLTGRPGILAEYLSL